MTVEAWLTFAIADAERRGLPELKPLLEGLAEHTRALREANFGESPLDFDRRGPRPADTSPTPPGPKP